MGNNDSKAIGALTASRLNIKDSALSMNNMMKCKKIVDAHYGEIILTQHPVKGDYIAIKEQTINLPKNYEKLQNYLKDVISKAQKNLVKIYQYQSTKQNNLCSTVYKIFTIFEYLERDLSAEIRTKRLQKGEFSEEKIWSMAKDVISAMGFLQKNKISHQALRSNSILIDDEGSYKIADPSLFPCIPDLATLINDNGQDNKGKYLSPELMVAFVNKLLFPESSSYKSDVFTFGVILLETVHLQIPNNLYNFTQGTISQKVLCELINGIAKKYSENLQNFIKEMLIFSSDDRPDWLKLQKNPFLSDALANNENKTTTKNFTSETKPKENIPRAPLGSATNKPFENTRYAKNTKTNSRMNNNSSLIDNSSVILEASVKLNSVKEVYEDGTVYEGEILAGLRQGYGVFYFSDGLRYEGNWNKNCKEGFGVLYNGNNNKIYEGQWAQDKYNGRGVLVNQKIANFSAEYNYNDFNKVGQKWLKFEGDFSNGKKEGNGVLYLSNGERYSGEFKSDSVHGKGCYIKKNKSVVKAEWKQNIFYKLC